jgi:hypothetical protein
LYVFPLIRAVQEQQELIEDQQEEIKMLWEKIEELEKRLGE